MRLLLITFLILVTALQAVAYHIAGGELTVAHITGNTFRIKLTLFRDCSNAQGATFDQAITVGVFRKSDDSAVDSFHVDLSSVTPVTLTGAACIPPPAVCLEQGEYIRNIQMLPEPAGYYLVWERCCRNASVANLNSPVNTGMAFYAEVANPAIQNSTPAFITPPAPFLCQGQLFRLNFQASDADGDSLVYSLTPPLNGGHTSNNAANPFSPGGSNQYPQPGPYSDAVWAAGYGINNICGGTPPLAINAVTGLIEGVASNLGIYALAVTVYEYRNGLLIGLVRREFEFTVIACTGNNAPLVSVSNSTSYDFNINASDTLCFDVKVIDPDGDSLVMIHYGELFQGDTAQSITAPFATSTDSSGGDTLQVTFCWPVSCSQFRDSVYKVYYESTDNGCPVPALVKTTLRIKVNPAPLPATPLLLCMDLLDSSTIQLKAVPDTTLPERYFVHYTIYRSIDGGPFTPYKFTGDYRHPDLTDSAALMHNIHNYCYVLTATNRCGVETAASDTVCTASAYNTLKNYLTSVSVSSTNSIELNWENYPGSAFSGLHIYRAPNDSNATPVQLTMLNGTTAVTYSDQTVHTNEMSYCYTLMNTDYCGNDGPVSLKACSILLKGKSQPFIHTLDWNEYINWTANVDRYAIERSDAVNDLPYAQINAAQDLFYSDKALDINDGIYRYRIHAYEGNGSFNGESFSNEIELRQQPVLWIPNAFTPDNDGKNETWGVSVSFVKTFSLGIYNRWGQLMWSTENPSDTWDGTTNGQAVPQDIYLYRTVFSGFDAPDILEKTGHLSVIR